MKKDIRKRVFIAFISLLGCLLIVTCNKDRNVLPMPALATAHINMYLTDSAANYQQVNVNIIGAQIHSDLAGWQPLVVHTGIYNLLAFNDTDTLLATGLVDSGHISQLRLILDSTGNTVMIDSTLYLLQTPSAQQSGLKLQIDTVLAADSTYRLTIDFNAAKSVIKTGNNTYILKPVISADITPSP